MHHLGEENQQGSREGEVSLGCDPALEYMTLQDNDSASEMTLTLR